MDTKSVEIIHEKIKSENEILELIDDEIKISPGKRNLTLSFKSQKNFSFLNNSLHWIQSRYRNADVMVKLIENIFNIFQNTKKRKAYHTLNNEIILVKRFISVQQIRFSNLFSFKMFYAYLIQLLSFKSSNW